MCLTNRYKLEDFRGDTSMRAGRRGTFGVYVLYPMYYADRENGERTEVTGERGYIV